jgi:hypothetical protein
MILFTPRLSRLSHSTHHLLVLIVEDFVSKVGTFVDGARGTFGTASTGMDEKLESISRDDQTCHRIRLYMIILWEQTWVSM